MPQIEGQTMQQPNEKGERDRKMSNIALHRKHMTQVTERRTEHTELKR